jgi:serine/threonine protein phosphatase PrpC
MDVAIRGDRACCLTMQLGPRTWLLAVTRGFGAVDGVQTERELLTQLRAECERRLRRERFRRAVDRPPAAATAVLAALARVNGEIFARTAGHDDYVTAACSLTAVLIVRGHAYVMHCGGTAAYLARQGDVSALSGDDTFDDATLPLWSRALGTSATLDVAVSSLMLDAGDVVVLLGRRVPGDVDRRTLIAHLESAGPAEHVLVARFEPDDAADEPAFVPRHRSRFELLPIVLRAAVAALLVLALVLAR